MTNFLPNDLEGFLVLLYRMERPSKLLKQYSCETCNFCTRNKRDFRKHEQTKKHISNLEEKEEMTINVKKSKLVCKICNNEYKSRSGLWNHAKKCISPVKVEIPPVTSQEKVELDVETFNAIMRTNYELKQMMMDQARDYHELYIKLNKKIAALTICNKILQNM